MNVLRWVVAPIVGLLASVVAGGLAVTLFEYLPVWVPFPYAAGGLVSALVFVYVVYKIVPTSDVRVVRYSAVGIAVLGVVSVLGGLVSETGDIAPGLGVLVGSVLAYSQPTMLD